MDRCRPLRSEEALCNLLPTGSQNRGGTAPPSSSTRRANRAAIVDDFAPRSASRGWKPWAENTLQQAAAFLTPLNDPYADAPFDDGKARNLLCATAWFAIDVGLSAGAACLVGAAVPALSGAWAFVATLSAVACEVSAIVSASPTRQMGGSIGFSGLVGVSMVPLAQAVGVGVCATAAVYTGALAGALVTTALYAELGSLQRLDGMRLSAVIGLSACSLASLFLPAAWGATSALVNLQLFGGLALFSALLAVDAGTAVAEAEAPHFNPVHRGMRIYLNIMGMFAYMAILLAK